MKLDYDASRLDELLQRLLDDCLTGNDRAALNSILRQSSAARSQYRTTLKLHAALIRHPQALVQTVVPLASAGPRHTQRRWWLGIAAAACILLGLGISQIPPRAPASISGMSSAVWTGGTRPDDALHTSSAPLDLASGFVEVSFRSGVRVILEGPCRFHVSSESSMDVAHGRATVKVPKHIDGFHLDTPAGRITDLGTEFGVAVGSGVEGPVILTEVFDGEIEIPAEETPRKRMQSGDSLAIVRETSGTRLISTLGDYRVNLGDSARSLPAVSRATPAPGNLALGKPVTSPAHYSMPHGSVFPADSLTDGRLNDSGSPGDWSFWLAPNRDSGEFTVDLLATHEIGRIQLQNTRNRTHGDRGMRHLAVSVSEDGHEFREIARAELQPIPAGCGPGVDFPIESLTFPPVTCRFVKITGLSHYKHPERPEEHVNRGGGLNEIQIFTP
jgi:ferric-dicitrate binding protein FerR (iron transport regulator)